MPHTIRTQRLLLRPWTLRDAPALYRAKNDFDVVKMTATWAWPVTEPTIRKRIEGAMERQHGPKAVFGIFADADANANAGANSDAVAHDDARPGVLLGSIGGGPLDESAVSGGDNVVGVGYMLARRAWGRGFAQEALRGWADFMFATYKVDAIVGEHWADNPASGRVMEKAGFREVGPVAPQWCAARQTSLPGVRYRLSRP